jgi:phospholipid-binding lipoprotein MlaA
MLPDLLQLTEKQPMAFVAASMPTEAERSAPYPGADPLETFNRASYRVNLSLERVLVRPIVLAYQTFVPNPVRLGVHNFIDNWNEPVVFINDGLQVRPRRAGSAGLRFSINTVLGGLGFFDVASRFGIDRHDNAFALTLGRAGMGPGPYIYLPLVGPTSARDVAGTVVDFLTNPITQVRHIKSESVEVVQQIANSVQSPMESVIAAVDMRTDNDAALRDIEATATDPYATLRIAYLQHMESLIAESPVSLDQSPDIPDIAPPPLAEAGTGGDRTASPPPGPPLPETAVKPRTQSRD